MPRPEIARISPFTIVQDAAGALSFYRDLPPTIPLFGIVRRSDAVIMFKRCRCRSTPELPRGTCSPLGRVALGAQGLER